MALMARKKNNPAARYAFIGLIVALIAGISTALIAIAKGMIALNMFPIQNTEPLNIAFNISWPLILVGLAAYAFMAPDAIRRFFSGRQARYGSNSLIMTAAFIGIVFVANYIAFNNPKSWDLTEDKSNTLAPETLRALATLPDKVTATAFYSTNLDKSTADDLLLKFKNNSNNKFDYKFVNPDSNPAAARQAGITGDGKILLEMNGRKEIASSASETELTRTLIRLISPQARVVYFLSGHGEADLQGGGQSKLSFSVASKTLQSKNYTVNSLNLLSNNKIPEDALAIIIAGPQKPLSADEVSLLKKYVDGGGSLVVMENPTPVTDFGDSPDPLAGYLVNDWGITLQNDIIFDLSSQQPLNATSTYGGKHPITENLSQNYSVIMPQARSLSVAEAGPKDVTPTALILTSANSSGVTYPANLSTQVQYDKGVDILGPLNMAVAGENATTKGRVVIFRNSVFASDDLFDYLC